MTAYFANALFDGESIHQSVFFQLENGFITSIETNVELDALQKGTTHLDGLVSAGFIDTQVNGGGGVLFNHEQSVDALAEMAAGHAQFGTTSMLPTLITDSMQKMDSAANAVALAIAQDISSIVGIHFEGPHISLPKKGIHSAQHVRSISDAELQTFTRKDIGKVLITVAPENLPTDIISELVQNGVIVSLGHSAASLETTMQAIDAGARGFTHLFNAMSGLTAREPGLIAAALNDVRVSSGLIADMHHVAPYNCLLAYKCIGPERLMLVTDAMAHVGSDISTLPWLDSTITRHDSKLTLNDGSLAGSCLDMASAVRNMYGCIADAKTAEVSIAEALTAETQITDTKTAQSKMNEATINEAKETALKNTLNMASKVPARFLGLNNVGTLRVGQQADFVLLDDQLSVEASWRKGLLLP
ncbi:N-acetylglucosamine-6-phosphate deacetylase [Glaciecola sp. MF2-115]|uniref:N-acetylglucosamine-6-phosphate deacetylase n=1 Tax=Glaciecola sp. MF2-115 TaxID=3384827 RepID=UPI0039A319E8